MKMIQPNCRIQFTAEDLDFIVATLGPKSGTITDVAQLLADPDSQDLILDNERLFHALLEQRGCLRISNHFYFYVLVRHVLLKSDVTETSVADYVAEMLAEYTNARTSQLQIPGTGGSIEYFIDMLAALQQADEHRAFFIRAHIANHALFLSGFFPQRIRSRAESRGFPSLRYYEALGQANFRLASDHRLAARYELTPIFATLAERFQTTRLALNDMSDRLVSIGDADSGVDSILLASLSGAE